MKKPDSKYWQAKFIMKCWPAIQLVLDTQGYQEDPAEGREMLAKTDTTQAANSFYST